MDGFCRSPFWDNNVTWNTENPVFTPCFERTVLLWIPCIFLLLFSPMEIFHIFLSKKRSLPWSYLNTSKTILTIMLMILSAIDLIYIIYDSSNVYEYKIELFASLVKIIVFGFILTIMIYNKKHGHGTSGLLFLFWMFLVLCNIPQLRSQIIKYNNGEYGNISKYPFISYIVYFFTILLIFLLNCFADKKPQHSKHKNSSPEDDSSFLSKLLFIWLDKLIWLGFKRSLTFEDVWLLNSKNSSDEIVSTFLNNWKRHTNKLSLSDIHFGKSSENINFRKAKNNKTYSILPTLFKTFGVSFIFGSCLRLINDLLVFIAPQILSLLITFIESDEPLWKGYVYVGILFASATIQSLIMSQYLQKMVIIGLRIRTALSGVIYRKTLNLSNNSRKNYTTGEIVNLMSVDASRFADVIITINLIWAGPLQISIALYFLWRILGPAVLAGLTVLIIIIPINALIANRLRVLQVKQMINKDKRVKLINEILNGIKIIKLYAWESNFEAKVLEIRNKEIKVLKESAYLNASTSFIWFCAPFLVSLATFAAYVLSDSNNVLDSKTAFVSLSLFNILRLPLTVIPTVISNIIQTHVSIKRIDKFMNAEEIDPFNIEHNVTNGNSLTVRNGSFSWGSNEPILKDINLIIPSSSLIAIIGSVGSGKSSLLSVFLGEMEKICGHVNTYGTIAYVPQQAWIQNTTLRNNILFGKKIDDIVYNDVLNACALKADLNVLPDGDQTEIGEKGVNLSGGQKQRVSLARAIYCNSDVYLLDDPLSAVDAHVGKHIFEHVIGPNGFLKHKTRLFVTHNITYLSEVDSIVVLKDGKITNIGTYEQLLERRDALADFLIQHNENSNYDKTDSINIKQFENLKTSKGTSQIQENTSKKSPINKFNKIDNAENIENNKIKINLIENERMETGGVKWGIYNHYIRSLGIFSSFLIFLTNVIFQGFSIGSNIWLSIWSTDREMALNNTHNPEKRDMYLGVYGLLGIFQVISLTISLLILFIGTLNASTILHNNMLAAILKSPLCTFFDVTPMGRILNRFSKEVDILDNVVPMHLRQWLTSFFNVIAALIVIILSTPLFILVVLPIGLIYYIVLKIYVPSSRQLKRMESVSRSPIYSHFSETIMGVTSIRAYNVKEKFIKESENKIDYNQKFYYPTLVSNRWLTIRLELIGNLVVLFSALFAVIQKDTTNSGLVGLSITYALQITRSLNWLMRTTSDVETNIVAVERMKEYTDIIQEAPWEIKNNTPRPQWPHKGNISLQNLEVKYRNDLESVLKGINCEIKSGEKVGIVGRTGSGKSTLTYVIFRLLEADNGRIMIDGIDISTIGLHSLRSRLTIIPQDPVLFSGSLRSNLDPFQTYSDNSIWDALEYAYLKHFITNLSGGLNHFVNEGGENFSVGQRQLICLARALLHKTQILIMDEATAAVDLETDDLIQSTIKTKFSQCTILTIAHRLHTIMDSDKILVLDEGKLVEFDKPEILLNNESSIFYNMAKVTGLV